MNKAINVKYLILIIILNLLIICLLACTPFSEQESINDIPQNEDDAVIYVIEKINEGDYIDAFTATTSFDSDRMVTLGMYSFCLHLAQEKDFDLLSTFLNTIKPDYNGVLEKEIKDFCLQYADIFKDFRTGNLMYVANEIKIKEAIKSESKIETKFEEVIGIGMNQEEIYSSFGYPDYTTSIENSSGICEQWIYQAEEKEVYLYFVNGVVTAIWGT